MKSGRKLNKPSRHFWTGLNIVAPRFSRSIFIHYISTGWQPYRLNQIYLWQILYLFQWNSFQPRLMPTWLNPVYPIICPFPLGQITRIIFPHSQVISLRFEIISYIFLEKNSRKVNRKIEKSKNRRIHKESKNQNI